MNSPFMKISFAFIFPHLDNFLSKGRHDKFNRKQSGRVFSIENWVHFNNIYPNQVTRISDEFHGQVSFSISQTTSYWSAYAGRMYWIERIHIEAQVNAITGFSRNGKRLAHNIRDTTLIDIGHSKDVNVMCA